MTLNSDDVKPDSQSNQDVRSGDPSTRFIPDLIPSSPSRSPGRVKNKHLDQGSANPQIDDVVKLDYIGKGGYGEVWKIKYVGSEEAGKFLPKELNSAKEAIDEALKARQVKHPNVVRVHGVLTDKDPKNYIIRMDFIPGRDLHKIVKAEGIMAPNVACAYMVQVADALDKAHEKNIFHQDIKPSNLILNESGRVDGLPLDGTEIAMITDFGVSAILSTESSTPVGGFVRGAPYFLAPEQLEARKQNYRYQTVDIWALGITFYYLLSREYPFLFMEKGVECILTDSPQPLIKHIPYIAQPLWSIIEKMLHREPQKRYQDMADVGMAITDFLNKINCPACEIQVITKEGGENCTNSKCKNPNHLNKYMRNHLLMRGGDECFSRCEYEEAMQKYQKVIDEEQHDQKMFTDRAAQLISAAKADKNKLTQLLDSVKNHISGNDLLHPVKEIDKVAPRFSSSKQLQKTHVDLQNNIILLYKDVSKETKRLIRETHFDQAKILLMKIERILRYEPILKEIISREKTPNLHGDMSAKEKASERNPEAIIKDLFSILTTRENYFKDRIQEIEQCKRQLYMGKAADILAEMQNFFNINREDDIRLYRMLQEDLDLITKWDLKNLSGMLEKDELPGSQIPLLDLRRRCDNLVAKLGSSGEISTISRISDARAVINNFIARLEEKKDKLNIQLLEAQKNNAIREQNLALKGLVAIADGTDIFLDEEHSRVHQFQEKNSKLIKEFEKLYRDGKALVDQNKYQLAIGCFTELDHRAPELFDDIAEQIKKCKETSLQIDRLGNQLDESLARINGDAFDLPGDFKIFFQLSQQLEIILPQDEWADQKKKINHVIVRLLSLQSHANRNICDDGNCLRTLMETTEVCLNLPKQVLLSCYSEKSSELNDSFLEFYRSIFIPLEQRAPSNLEIDRRIEYFSQVVHEFSRLNHVVDLLISPKGSPHPVDRLSQLMMACPSTILIKGNSIKRLEEIIDLHRQLINFTRDPVQLRKINAREKKLRWRKRMFEMENHLRRFVNYFMRAVIPAITAIVVWLCSYIVFHNLSSTTRLNIANNSVAQIFGPAMQLPDGQSAYFDRSDEELSQFLRQLQIQNTRITDNNKVELRRWGSTQVALLKILESLENNQDKKIVESFNPALQKNRKNILQSVDAALKKYIEDRLADIASSIKILDPLSFSLLPNQEARSEIDWALNLGMEVMKFDKNKTSNLTRSVEKYDKWMDQLDHKGSASFENNEIDNNSIRYLLHVRRIVLLAREMIHANREIYLFESKVDNFEELLHSYMAKIIDLRNAGESLGNNIPVQLSGVVMESPLEVQDFIEKEIPSMVLNAIKIENK